MVDPTTLLPRTASAHEALREALSAVEAGHAVAIATVVARRGSSPATPGQKLALTFDTVKRAPIAAVGTVGGGAVEQAVLRTMLDALADPASTPRVHTFRLGASLGMCCGGAADILVEVMRAGAAVLVVGAGHVGLATSKLLAELGFSVTVCDAREPAGGEERTAAARAAGVRFVNAEHDDPEVLSTLGAAPETSAMVVMTHDHQLDQRVVEWALARGFVFVGGVGSRAKAERTRQRLEAKGFAQADIARVRMPVGTPIGARRPLEIAVAIAGELIELRARREGLVRTSPAEPAAESEEAAPAEEGAAPVSSSSPIRAAAR